MAEERKIRFSPITEQTIIAAALVSADVRAHMTARLPQDAFVVDKHQAIWSALKEADRQKIEPDRATLHRLSGGTVDLKYVHDLLQHLPEPPDFETLDAHITAHKWDAARAKTLSGPVNAFLDEVAKPKADPARVLALADSISQSLRGYEERRAMHGKEALVREMHAMIEAGRAGRAVFPYGVPQLDVFEEDHPEAGRARCVPGAKPGQVTVLTAISGGGKSSVAARAVLGLARQKRKVLYGAWEPDAKDMLALLAAMSCNFSRTAVTRGELTADQSALMQERATQISEYVSFMGNPFLVDGKGKERASNERNLETIEGYIADSGADVFVADLFERCLVEHGEAEERLALFKMQRILQRTRCHGILLAQQRLKDIELRPDKRPTREGIKGSSAWVDVADTILGVHTPGLFKDLDKAMSTIELLVLKQRWGTWPLVVECEWDAEYAKIGPGKTIPWRDPQVGLGQIEGQDAIGKQMGKKR